MSHASRSALPAVWWMTDEKRTKDPVAVLARLPRGAAVILRHYEAPGRERLAQALADRCRVLGLRLLVAGTWRLAARVDAAGLHLPDALVRRGAPPGARLWLKQKKRLLTAAAHEPRGLARARIIGADAAFLSPVFPTSSHPLAKPLGVTVAATLARDAGLPVVALGGVTPRQRRALNRRGFAGVAGIGFGLEKSREG